MIGVQDILAGAAAVAAGAYIVRRTWRMLRGRACGCGTKLPPRRAVERLPDSRVGLKVLDPSRH